jgi:acetyl-CoA C-acetyltransferase
MNTNIWVLGAHQSDFARNLTKEAVGVDGLVAEVVHGTIDDAGIPPAHIGTVHVANAFGELFTGQAHLGAMPATVCPELWGVPASRHEAACASGSVGGGGGGGGRSDR